MTALVFNVNDMVWFDAFGMRIISVACKDFVDRSAMCSAHNSKKLYICWKKKVYKLVLRSSNGAAIQSKS